MKDTPSSVTTPNDIISSSQTTTTYSEHAINHKTNSKSSTIGQLQNDENKNIISLDDNNQNILSTTTPVPVAHKKLVSSDSQKITNKSQMPTKYDDDDDDDDYVNNTKMINSCTSDSDSTELMTTSQHAEAPLPDWVAIDESVLIRPYNTSGVISFIGPTHFQVCENSIKETILVL